MHNVVHFQFIEDARLFVKRFFVVGGGGSKEGWQKVNVRVPTLSTSSSYSQNYDDFQSKKNCV